ncbi:MAG: ATP-binding protein [Candidatus Omnitrophica bacterium]|nr:ATP-binding protein [Candidatus Omnitrophota bacterium]
MFSPLTVFLSVFVYIALLFCISLWVERNGPLGRKLTNNAWVYSLSLAVYCTAWTYYGSVGKAAASGMLFLTIYLGPTLAVIFWWLILRKMARIKNTYRITSIADFISARYNKSQGLAAIATAVAFVGILPYIALQLKAIFSTFDIITNVGQWTSLSSNRFSIDMMIVMMLILFSILFGVRRLDPTERHPGMIMTLVVQSIIKLVAFLAVGIFVTYGVFGGFGDIFRHINANPLLVGVIKTQQESVPYTMWMTYLILAMFAILFLPRQFHVAVVENSEEKHIRTAMWLFPLYMFLLNIFVYPIAMGGLLEGYSIAEADTFVLKLPLSHGYNWLGLFVFLGGLSAAMGMIMVASVTISTMVVNHWLLPVVGKFRPLGFLRKNLLQCRWLAVCAVIMAGWVFAEKVGASYTLVNIGMISFAAALQFAPVILGGIFWKKANRIGATLGLSAGFLVWIYTILIPSFVKSGWISKSLIENGPFGIGFLNPEHLFGIVRLDSLSHGVLWSMLFNIGLYILGSVCFKQEKEEEDIADEFVDILSSSAVVAKSEQDKPYIALVNKKTIIEDFLCQYFSKKDSGVIIEKCLVETGLGSKEKISIVDLAELNGCVEKYLSGTMGTASAHRVLKESGIFSAEEAKDLESAYAEIIANLKLSPEDLKGKIDYYQERETLITKHALELETKIKELEENIRQRKRAEEELKLIQNELERRVQERTADLVKANDALRIEITERKRTEEELQHNYESQGVINRLLNLSLTGISVDELVRSALDLILKINWLSFESKGAIFLAEENKELLVMKAQNNLPEQIQQQCSELVFGKCLCGRAASTKKAQYANCIDEKHEILYEGITPHGHYCVPIVFSEKVLGVLNLYIKENHTYNPKEEEFIHTIASVLAGIIMRKRAEEKAEIEKEKAQRYFDIAGVLLLVINKDYTVNLINNRGCKILGFTEEEIIGRNWDNFVAENEKETVKSIFTNMLKNDAEAPEYFENDLLTKSGEKRLIAWHNTVLKNEQGEVIGTLSSGEDITDRKLAEIQLKEAYEKLKHTQSQLLQSSKMAAVGQLASGVAHEINNPLTGVLNNVQLIKMEMDAKTDFKPDEFKELINIVEDSANRCKNIIRSLLDFARASSGLFQVVSLNDVIDKVVALIGHEMKLQNINIEKKLDPYLPQVMGDLQLIQQVIFNIISNAKWAIQKKSGKEGGAITITTSYNPHDKIIFLRIQDTGIGIPKENLERIFEPFFTTKPVGEGTGLGLPFVYNIIKNHKGNIEVESQENEGTVFKISLPSTN